jgi:hypothetical protein
MFKFIINNEYDGQIIYAALKRALTYDERPWQKLTDDQYDTAEEWLEELESSLRDSFYRV